MGDETLNRKIRVAKARRDVKSGALPAIPKPLTEMLRWAIASENNYPSRPEWDERLKTIESAAQFLRGELAELRTRALLLDGDEWFENENETYHGLADIAARAARVRNQNPRRQGRGQLHAEASNGPSPKELCALIVALSFNQARGKRPGKSDVGAQSVCEALWQDAGGPERAGFVVESWRTYLKEAKNFWPPHPAGLKIQRILSPVTDKPPMHSGGKLIKLLARIHSRALEPEAADSPSTNAEPEGGEKTSI